MKYLNYFLGFDGANAFDAANFEGFQQASTNLVSTETIPVQIIAIKPMEPMDDGANIEWDVAQANNFQDRVVLWSNKMVNSPYGVCPLRMCYEPESHDNIRMERDRLLHEVENLQPKIVDCNGTLVKIHHRMSPTMNDGKVESVWSDTYGMSKCTICLATPTEMSKPKGKKHASKL